MVIFLQVKKSIILTSIAILLSFAVLLPLANAQEIQKENEEIEQLAADLEFLMEEAAIYD